MSFFDYPSEVPATPVTGPVDVLLADASEADWATLLAHTQTRRFDPGEVIVTDGEVDRSLYLVLEGELAVMASRGRRGYRKIAVVGAGSVIGELAFFDGGARSALVRAATPAVLAEMSPGSFDALAVASPALARQLLFDLGRILARRLRAAQAAAPGGN